MTGARHKGPPTGQKLKISYIRELWQVAQGKNNQGFPENAGREEVSKEVGDGRNCSPGLFQWRRLVPYFCVQHLSLYSSQTDPSQEQVIPSPAPSDGLLSETLGPCTPHPSPVTTPPPPPSPLGSSRASCSLKAWRLPLPQDICTALPSAGRALPHTPARPHLAPSRACSDASEAAFLMVLRESAPLQPSSLRLRFSRSRTAVLSLIASPPPQQNAVPQAQGLSSSRLCSQ